MSQQAVRFIVHTLLTDECFRDRFARSPMEVLVDLRFWADVELTLDEMEALVQTSPEVWRSAGGVAHARIH
jgi:hypothetical protein